MTNSTECNSHEPELWFAGFEVEFAYLWCPNCNYFEEVPK